MKTTVVAMVIVAAVGLVACGSSDKTSSKAKVTPVKLQPVTTEEVTPQACLDALDTAETIFSKAGDGITVMGDTIGTVSGVLGSFDVGEINAATEQIKANTAKIQAMSAEVGDLRSTFDSEAEDCRAAG